MASDAVLRAQVDELRRQVAELQSRLSPSENVRSATPFELLFGRITAVSAGPVTIPPGPPFFYTVGQQKVSPPLSGSQHEDTGFEVRQASLPDYSPRPQPFAQNVMVCNLEHRRFLVPFPGTLIPIQDAGAGGPFGRLGEFVHVNPTGPRTTVVAAPSGPLPMLNCNPDAQFFTSTPPYRSGNVYLGIHVWPLPPPAAPLAGVDIDDGFFIVWTPPRGVLAATITRTINFTHAELDSAGGTGLTFTLEVDHDSTGNVIDVRFTKT